MIRALFKRLVTRQPEPTDESANVPADVMAAIGAASIVVRHGGDSPNERILVQLGVSGGAFWHDVNTDASRLRGAFDLNKTQSERAAKYLANRIHLHLRKLENAVQPQRSGWGAWRPFTYEQ